MSRALSERFGLVHVEVDKHAVGKGDDPLDPGPGDWLPAYRTAMSEIRACLGEGRSVVFDAVGHKRKHRDRMRRLAASVGAELTIVHMDVEVEEARRRLLGNRERPVRPNVPDDGFAEIVSAMEPPEPDEAAVVYRPSEPLIVWIERVMTPLFEETNS